MYYKRYNIFGESTYKVLSFCYGLLYNEYKDSSYDATKDYKSGYCKNNNWLFRETAFQWLLNPHSGRTSDVFNINGSGYVRTSVASYDEEIKPVIYFKQNVTIIDGVGTKDKLY